MIKIPYTPVISPTDQQDSVWQATDWQIRLGCRQGLAHYPLFSWDRQRQQPSDYKYPISTPIYHPNITHSGYYRLTCCIVTLSWGMTYCIYCLEPTCKSSWIIWLSGDGYDDSVLNRSYRSLSASLYESLFHYFQNNHSQHYMIEVNSLRLTVIYTRKGPV